MARRSYASSTLRYVQPRYYIKRPKRLALLFLVCISLTWFVYDRQSLNKEHQEDILRLKTEVSLLQNTLQVIKGNIKGSEETIQNDENNFTEDDDDAISLQRREKVKEAMLHAWTSYENYAWGMDELKPQSMSGVDSFGGLGATIVDSLDTLFIMGLHTQFKRAREWIAKSLYFNKNIEVSVFETTIRVLGGLLSAYDLSGDEVFLDKARDIADRILPAWNTPSGIPYNRINLLYGKANNPRWTRGSSILADSGSEQLEFIALSQRTNDPKYQQKAEKVIRELHRTFPEDGLLPIYLDPLTGNKSSGAITFGAMGDSFYEYLLKAWIQGNKTEPVKFYREMWESSMKGLQSLIRKSTPSSFVYITERLGTTPFDKMDELACFVPGMLALGSSGYGTGGDKFMSLAEEILSNFLTVIDSGIFCLHFLPSNQQTIDILTKSFARPTFDRLISKLGMIDIYRRYRNLYYLDQLAWTCYNFYQSTPTKLAGENYYFRKGEDIIVGTSWNIQRPETIESLFYLWRFTKNKTYQEWGWNIFEAFENNSRIETGYVGLKDVTTGAKDNMMQSFFLAETLKYLYLLFSPPSVIPLDEWVFNTEAHPLRIVTRNAHQDGQGLSAVQEDKIPRHLHGRKEGRMDYK